LATSAGSNTPAGVVARGRTGAWLGTALVAELPRNGTVMLTTPSRLLVVGHREFHALMDEMPQLRLQLLDGLARRLRDLEPEATD